MYNNGLQIFVKYTRQNSRVSENHLHGYERILLKDRESVIENHEKVKLKNKKVEKLFAKKMKRYIIHFFSRLSTFIFVIFLFL